MGYNQPWYKDTIGRIHYIEWINPRMYEDYVYENGWSRQCIVKLDNNVFFS